MCFLAFFWLFFVWLLCFVAVIYNEIDQLEKKEIRQLRVDQEMPATPEPFLNWALVILLFAWSIQLLYFKTHG